MYYEFDKACCSLGMPCSLAKPMSEFSYQPAAIPPKLLDKDISKHEEKKDVDEQPESTASPLPSSSSSSSCSSQETSIKEEVPILVSKESPAAKEEGGRDGDDGYHTPTSPSHRIPAPTECPPAPKKPAPSLRAKRRRGSSRARRHIDIDGSEIDDLLPKAKKARGTPGAAE